MNQFKRIKTGFLIATLVLILFSLSCNYSGSTSTAGTDDSNDKIPSKPIKEIIWETDSFGNTQFYENNPDIIDIVNGNTGWQYGDMCEATMNTIEVDVCRMSGIKRKYGYGVIFCVQDIPNPVDGYFYNFLAVLIDIDGEFCIVRCTDTDEDGEFEDEYLVNWQSHDDLATGYGVFNKISVKYNGKLGSGNDSFTLIFNDIAVSAVDFEYDQSVAFDIVGRFGYIVTLAPDEDFPDHPVDFRFRQITPADILLP